MAKKARIWDGSQWVDIASAVTDLTQYANLTTTPISGFRNLLINGDMRINQRGVTSTTTDGTFCFDRWKMNNSGGTCTYTAQTFTPGNAISGYEPTNHARIVTSGQSTSGHFAMFRQNIEDIRTFAGQTVTVSFWAKAASGAPKVALELEQNFGTGGSPSSAVTTYAGQVTLSTSWARYSLTVTMPSISGKTIGTTANTSHVLCSLFVSAGSDWNARTGTLGIQSNTFDFWGVQAEPGSIATPFEQRPIGTELALCQRYFYKIESGEFNIYNPYWNVGLSGGGQASFDRGSHPVTMRIAPLINSSPNASTNSLHSFNYASYNTGEIGRNCSVSSTTINKINIGYSSDNNGTSLLPVGYTWGYNVNPMYIIAEL